MEILLKKQDCCGCHACYNACPVQAVSMETDDEGFLYPKIDGDKCINCGRCKKVCPVLNIPKVNPYEEAYACYAADNEEHMSSSSGGAFAVLARQVLKKGGAVCGAAFDESMVLKHILIESESELYKLKGTKYVQSTVGNAYSEMEKVLKTGRIVLFSGTPCQVAGLKTFLRKEYDNLLTMDLICHGVPSPGVFSRYLAELSDNPIMKMTFRNKSLGVSNATLDYKISDGTVIREKYSESPYIIGFIQNLFNRSSCFHCNFKGEKRVSDITVGDFWGVKEYHPSFFVDSGVSAVIVHSDNGKCAFEKMHEKMVAESATVDEIKTYNSCLIQSVDYNPKREEFFKMWKGHNISESVMALRTVYTPKKEKFINNVKGRIKRWLA